MVQRDHRIRTHLFPAQFGRLEGIYGPPRHIQVVRIPPIGMKRKPLTNVESSNMLVHVKTINDIFQTVLGFLCRHVLHLPDVYACVDAFAAYNGM